MNEEKKIVFIPSGRLGNAIFRYMSCVVLSMRQPSLTYTLQKDFVATDDNAHVFYPGLDHEGDDIKGSALSNPFVEGGQNPHMGYNTLGFYKHTINVDKLTSNQYINKENGQGLYVKKNLTITDETFLKQWQKNLKPFNIYMDGFFQFSHLYLKYKAQILEYMKRSQDIHRIQTDTNEIYLMREIIEDLPLLPSQQYDIVIHIRLGDFNGRPEFIEACYYIQLFETLDFQGKTICLLCEPIKSESDAIFIDKINHWFRVKDIPFNCETNSLLVDFNIMKQCKTLICSMSTLAWTAAYLSNHIQQCYMPNYNFYEVPLRQQFFFKKPIENTILYHVKTTSPSLSQITPYIITLPEYASRLEKLDDLLINLSMIGLETIVYNGVNGKKIDISNADKTILTYENTTYKYDNSVRLNGKAMTRGEFGCAWSHLNLIKQLAQGQEQPQVGQEQPQAGQAYYLILEDDVELVKPLDELYTLLQHLPEDTDLCHLAKSDWYPFTKTRPVNPYFYECEKNFFNKTTAYLISNKGAKKIMEYINHSINVPIDDLFNMIYRLTPDFRFYVPNDYFFKEQDNILSTIKDIDH